MTILDKLKEKYIKDHPEIDKAVNISEALSIVHGVPHMAAEPIVTILETEDFSGEETGN
jgi:hypothetical protein